ncbi:unnamed protein product [Rotaria socialis]|uniref:Uncharacterized protein n=1 Tax=Rotaria socialis TaxID=392032 RepID=A0A821F132_9BILA|nr:unnamed protein product [Rotaria socialis]CAF4268220.1 unnamed protein product [Rotaria socialis]CAF4415482.1 unnamed protein product [Rotaria socialis]CAF4573105.1 unnamed protein product [Rotaria socialis]CAF4646059.1 unnamed protein product [Rotaria socialis]
MTSNNDCKSAVKTTINKLKDDLQNYERLAGERVKLSTDMNVFELTAQKQEVEKRLKDNQKQLRTLAKNIETDGKLFIALEDEYDTSNN